jgi:L-ribulose-5-phosphate 4-epimerase
VPVTRCLSAEEIGGGYEAETGRAIVERFTDAERPIDAWSMPAVLVAAHASFCWGASVSAAAHTAEVLEEVARMAYYTVMLTPDAAGISSALLDKHYLRKHGPTAYYGQHGKGS